VLNKHKKRVLGYVDWYVDGNLVEELKLVSREVYERILSTIAEHPFMVKPLYYPVAWGGELGSRESRSFLNRWQTPVKPASYLGRTASEYA